MERDLLRQAAEALALRGLKQCIKCGEVKPVDEFWTNTSSNDGFRGNCKKCQAKIQKQYAIENRNKIAEREKVWREKNRDRLKRNRLESAYSITPETYDNMLERQNYLCANPGCSNPPEHIDHDNKCCDRNKYWKICGQCIRGLLCPGCNLALGLAHESADRLRGLATYILEYESTQVMKFWGFKDITELACALSKAV